MGEVYRAHDLLTNQTVAMKRVRFAGGDENATKQEDWRVALAREFHTLARLRHPHIISVLDYGFDADGQPYFTMEHLANAQNVLNAATPLPYEGKLALLTQLLSALVYLHQQPIVHRDLKPDNVLVVAGNAKLLDFGLAFARQPQDNEHLAGTLAYFAPEVIEGAPPSVQSDLYALGLIAYEILVGEFPYDRSNSKVLLLSVMAQAIDWDANTLGDTVRAWLQRLIAKDPADRYRTAREALRDLATLRGVPLGTQETEHRESFLKAAGFVGRTLELAQLADALNDARRGVGSTWLIGGESGVGKTRLLDEVRARAMVRGALVLRGQAISEATSPYYVFREIARHLALVTPITDEQLSILKAVVTDAPALLGRNVPDAPALDAQSTQRRWIKTLSQLFDAQSQPILLILEDLQWARSAWHLLAMLAQLAPERRWLIVGSYRDDETPELPEEVLEARTLSLKRFSPEEIAHLTVEMVGANGNNPDLLHLLQRETNGNAFFLVEVVRALAEESGTLDEIGMRTLPQSVFAQGVQTVLQRRLARVPAPAYPLLEVAAVAGRRLDLEVLALANALDGYWVGDLEDWVQSVADVKVLDIVGNRWQFAHDKLREAILSQVSADHLRALHRSVAQAIEAVHPNDPIKARQLAKHWQVAGNPAQEAVASALAGEYAYRLSLFVDARHFLGRALDLEAAIQAHGGFLADALKLRMLLGETVYSLADYTTAQALLADGLAQAHAENAPRHVARALNLLGNIHLARGEYAQARERLEACAAHSAQHDDTREQGQALRSLGVLHYTLNDYATAQQHFERALPLLLQAADAMGVAGTHTNLANVLHETDPQAAETHFVAALQGFAVVGFLWGEAYTRTSLGMFLLAHGRPHEATAEHERALALCREIGHVWGESYTLSNLAEALLALAQPLDAIERLREAIHLSERIQATPMSLRLAYLYGQALWSLGLEGDALAVFGVVWAHPNVEAMDKAQLARFLQENELDEDVFPAGDAAWDLAKVVLALNT